MGGPWGHGRNIWSYNQGDAEISVWLDCEMHQYCLEGTGNMAKETR